MKKKKFALVLSGGGFNGAFQLGALNYINENWKQITGLTTPMKFDIVAGVSTGSLNGALIAMDKLPLLNDLWVHQIGRNGVSEIYSSDIIDTSSKEDKLKLKISLKQLAKKLIPEVNFKLRFFEKLGLIFSKKKRKKILDSIIKDVKASIKVNLSKFKSIADNTPLRKKLERYLDRSAINTTKFLCGFVSLDTGKYHGVLHHEFASEQDFVNGVIASTSIPMVFNPIDRIRFNSNNGSINSLNNVDGGIRNVSPLGDVIKLINEDPESEYKIIIINCNSGIPKHEDYSEKSIGAIAGRSMYDIVMTEVFNNDLNQFMKINELVKQAKAWDNEIALYNSDKRIIKEFDAVVISPSPEVELGNALVVNQKLINLRLEHGYEVAASKKYFK